MDLLGQALAEGRRLPAVELPGDPDVREGNLDAVHRELRVARAEGHRHAALAAAGVEHASRLHGLDLALELLELRVAAAPLDHLAGLLPGQHADPLLQELEPCLPAQPLVLLLLGKDVGLAALQVAEPRADTRRLLGVTRIGARGVRGRLCRDGGAERIPVRVTGHRAASATHPAGPVASRC